VIPQHPFLLLLSYSLGHISTIYMKDISSPIFAVVDGIAEGGFATVVKVKHVEENAAAVDDVRRTLSSSLFAMKVIPKRRYPDAIRLRNQDMRLLNELSCMTDMVPSPFIQQCHFAFENKVFTSFVLDLVGGGDMHYHLVNRINSGEMFSEHEVRILSAELYLALEHLHKHNIVHRDVKVENIMLTDEGHVKLVDFGSAVKISREVSCMKTAGSLIHTPPEVIVYKVGGRFTDWWAYGVVAHELLTGYCPWSTLFDRNVIKSEIIHKPILNHSEDSKLSPEASAFVKGLMCRDFEQRMGTKSDSEIKTCSFFSTIDWNQLARLELPPAFVPQQEHLRPRLEEQDAALETYFKLAARQQASSSI
jgi:serine/threonine protein kinase